jgi:hypothetical protein
MHDGGGAHGDDNCPLFRLDMHRGREKEGMEGEASGGWRGGH